MIEHKFISYSPTVRSAGPTGRQEITGPSLPWPLMGAADSPSEPAEDLQSKHLNYAYTPRKKPFELRGERTAVPGLLSLCFHGRASSQGEPW